MNWSNDETIAFLEAYKSEPCIWNPQDEDHKDKKKKKDAWVKLSRNLKKPVKELKAKKEALMTTFRKHIRRKQESIGSGVGTEDIFQPTWFAYEFMESFLMPLYSCKYTFNHETTQFSHRRSADRTEQKIAANHEQLPQVSYRRYAHPASPEPDDCDLYAKLLAKKLREIPKDERLKLMYQIDGLFINRLHSNRRTPSPTYSFACSPDVK